MDFAWMAGELVARTTLAREEIPPQQRRTHLLMIDECSWFMSQTLADMADQVRKYGLGLCLAAQRLSQIKPDEVLDAIFANFANLVCFGLGEQGEANYVARHLNTPGLGPEEIRRLPPFQGYAQLLLNGQRVPASLESPVPPIPVADPERRWRELLDCSRQRYARPRHEVEAALAEKERRGAALPREPEIRILDSGSLPLIADAGHASR